MAVLPINNAAGVASVQNARHIVGTFIAGEPMFAGSPVYIQVVGTQSRVFLASALSAATARCIGFVTNPANTVQTGDLVTIVSECTFAYPQPTPPVMGSRVYLSLTPGQFDNVQQGGIKAVGVFVPDNSVTQSGNTRTLLWLKKLV